MPPKSCIIKIALTNDDMIHHRNSCQHAELLHTIGNSDILSGWLQTATWMIVCVIRIMPLLKAVCDIPINKSMHKKDRCGSISLPASVSFYPMLFSTHEFPMEVHPDHGKMSFSFQYNRLSVPALFQFLSHSILLLYHPHSQL